MQNRKGYRWLCGILLIICLGQFLYIYVSSKKTLEPTRVISTTSVGDNGAIYEVLFDSGGATTPFVYRYYLMRRQNSMDEVLEEVKVGNPFLVTKSTAAVRDVLRGRVKLKVMDTIYDYHNVSFYKVDGEIKIIKFDLDSKMP